ncbi:uncharacterized protein LOC100378740 [Saccoglossus kowalevskii]|uniref:Uncharacterized protein LOC100378740 n=1 Tax=Saccoglossus kowalevskii TaxID=10224 RepID=A0ABM0GXZ9_SACKO|nr:PREDICTED: uncharacterized protein LOC100378740 [Saccoglossus kowalevskii]
MIRLRLHVFILYLLILCDYTSGISGHALPATRTYDKENTAEHVPGKSKSIVTEDQAWDFLGIERCSTGLGRKCFFQRNEQYNMCFSGIDAICDGVLDCQCDENDEFCLTDENHGICDWIDIVGSLMKQGLPRFGYGKSDSFVFNFFWIAGFEEFCSADEKEVTGFRCHSDPTVCITPDEMCDGAFQCQRACDKLLRSPLDCPSDEGHAMCEIKNTFDEFFNKVTSTSASANVYEDETNTETTAPSASSLLLHLNTTTAPAMGPHFPKIVDPKKNKYEQISRY